MKKRISLLIAMALSVSVLSACGAKSESPDAGNSDKVIELKMSTTTADTSTWTLGARKFAEIVKEKSNGKYNITVYPNEQLGGGNQGKGLEMLMSGSADFTYHSNIIYSIMDERFGVISLPWLVPDTETADRALSGAGGEAINALLEEKGIKGLGFGENGFRQITNSKAEITSPEDMKGMKIRIPGIKMYVSLYKALGADPITMNFSEVFTALQQNTIDGQENPTDVIASSKLNEVQDYMTEWNYSYDALILGMNKKLFDGMDAETQQMFIDAGKEANEYQRKLNRETSKSQTQEFIDGGMKVTALTAEQIEAFRASVESVYAEYEPIMGKELIDSFK